MTSTDTTARFQLTFIASGQRGYVSSTDDGVDLFETEEAAWAAAEELEQDDPDTWADTDWRVDEV